LCSYSCPFAALGSLAKDFPPCTGPGRELFNSLLKLFAILIPPVPFLLILSAQIFGDSQDGQPYSLWKMRLDPLLCQGTASPAAEKIARAGCFERARLYRLRKKSLSDGFVPGRYFSGANTSPIFDLPIGR
jgi:hypothetical protein